MWAADPPAPSTMLHTCHVDRIEDRPRETGSVWYQALDGSGWRGYTREDVSDARWETLTLLKDQSGASLHETATHHYIVETDVPADAEADFNAWYDTEHLPGLALVPGTVRAVRYRRTQGHPTYLACYDLVSPDVLGCEAWLAIRGTPWSSRVRPQFFNTRRTMFRRVDELPS
ncbi:MAG: DUF4286 family protein [Burkholderiaceae bacterium]